MSGARTREAMAVILGAFAAVVAAFTIGAFYVAMYRPGSARTVWWVSAGLVLATAGFVVELAVNPAVYAAVFGGA